MSGNEIWDEFGFQIVFLFWKSDVKNQQFDVFGYFIKAG